MKLHLQLQSKTSIFSTLTRREDQNDAVLSRRPRKNVLKSLSEANMVDK